MRPPHLLRSALLTNATFSALTGSVLFFFSGPLSHAFGLEPAWVLQLIGAGLWPFAIGVGLVGLKAEVNPKHALAISVMDGGWVLGTILLAILWPETMNTIGWTAAWAVAGMVALMGFGQTLGVRSATRNVTRAIAA